MSRFDAVVIGSGLSGLHSAYPLVESGLNVAMLDVGTDESKALEEGAPLSFSEKRRSDPAQYAAFLGEDLSGIGAVERDEGHARMMTSGRRSFIVRSAPELLPVRSGNAIIIESLGRGGLSEAWGAACDFFDEGECEAVGIPASELPEHYRTIIERIGVSGESTFYRLQPPAHLDDNQQHLFRKYAARGKPLGGLSLKRSALALLTEDKGGRQKTAYRDMDFWDNIGRSIYRGHYTLEELERHPNFTYIPRRLVSNVHPIQDGVRITAEDLDTEKPVTYEARAVILAAGAVNTTRLLLASFNRYDEPVPIILKNNYLVPNVLLARLGKTPSEKRHSLCQLVLESSEKQDGMTSTYVQLYSYNSLLLYKLLRFVPLPVLASFRALALLVPSIVLADIRFPSVSSPEHQSVLRKDPHGRDYLEIIYPRDIVAQKREKRGTREVIRALLSLGLVPMRVIENSFGATSHYAGGVPASEEPLDGRLSVDRNGKLHNAEGIFVADSASWNAIPAKPPGLTMMANANRIGTSVREYLNHQK